MCRSGQRLGDEDCYDRPRRNRHRFKTRDGATFAVFSYAEGFYNAIKRHSTPGHHSPMEYEKMWSEDAELATCIRSSGVKGNRATPIPR